MAKKIIGIIVAIVALASGITAVFALTGNDIAGLISSEPKNIMYDGNCITWDECNGVSYYDVKIDEASPVKSNSAKYSYKTDREFTVTVTAVYEKSQKPVTVTFKPLGKIAELKVSDDGVVTWDTVADADAYLVSVNGLEDTIPGTSISFKEGNNTVKVKPVVKGDSTYYSFWSETKNIRICATPGNIKYDGKEISWSGNSASYEVSVNGEKQYVKGNKLAYASEERDFDIEVVALGDHISSFDSGVASEKIRYLQTVSSLYVVDGVLRWDAVAGATGYKIKINNVEKTLTENYYEDITAGSDMTFSVMPINNSNDAKYFSVWSAAKTVHILKAPTISWNGDIAADGGNGNTNVVWDDVRAADGYEVRFTKQGQQVMVEPTSADGNCFKYPYTEVGEYTVEVKAKAGDDGNCYDSQYSSLIRIIRLPAPKAATNNFIVSDKNNIASGFTVNFMQVANAKSYKLYKDGSEQNGVNFANGQAIVKNVIDSSVIDERSITYGIRSIGEAGRTVGKEKVVVLSSLDTLNFEITVKATPHNLNMDGFNLSWDSVAGNNGYCVKIDETNNDSRSEMIELRRLTAGNHKIKVVCCGNGSNVLPSNPTATYTVKRLSAPSISRVTSEANGTVICNKIDGATGYSLYFDENLDNAYRDQDTITNAYSLIKTEGTTLAIVAEANKLSEDGTYYIMSSEKSTTKTFIKLKAPEFPAGAIANSKDLKWNAPTNITISDSSISYEVYDGDLRIDNGERTGCMYTFPHEFAAGDHRMRIKAKASGERYVDSELSAEICFTKLDMPELSVDRANKCYVWNNIPGATSYYLKIGNNKVYAELNDVNKECKYTPSYTAAGTYHVTVKAVGDGRNYIDSNECVLEQKVVKLVEPKAVIRYSSDYVDIHNGAVTVEITTPSENCTKYAFTVGGVTEVGSEGSLTYSKVIKNPGRVTASVKALGGNFDEENTYYTDSNPYGGDKILYLYLLAQPNSKEKILSNYGIFEFDAVTDAKNYEYQISYDGGSYGESEFTSNRKITIDNFKSYRSIKIRLRATGAGDSRYISSEWTEYTWYNPD